MREAGLSPHINNVKTLYVAPESCTIDKVQARHRRLKMNLGVTAKLLGQVQGVRCYMVTLTYKDAKGHAADDIRNCLRHVRQWAARSGFKLRYLWVMEVQDRKSGMQKGEWAPHYHLVVWVPNGVSLPQFDRMGWWPHGMTNTVLAVAPIRYVMKYASKFDNPAMFPKGRRVYGVGGLTAQDMRSRRWLNWPRCVQAVASVDCPWVRRKGGGWVNKATGQFLASEWGISGATKTSTRLIRLHHHPRPFGDALRGPFSWISALSPAA